MVFMLISITALIISIICLYNKYTTVDKVRIIKETTTKIVIADNRYPKSEIYVDTLDKNISNKVLNSNCKLITFVFTVINGKNTSTNVKETFRKNPVDCQINIDYTIDRNKDYAIGR